MDRPPSTWMFDLIGFKKLGPPPPWISCNTGICFCQVKNLMGTKFALVQLQMCFVCIQVESTHIMCNVLEISQYHFAHERGTFRPIYAHSELH